jgi:hypothetical protein
MQSGAVCGHERKITNGIARGEVWIRAVLDGQVDTTRVKPVVRRYRVGAARRHKEKEQGAKTLWKH